MKFILLSDPHLLLERPKARTDDAVQACWDKLEWVYNFAFEEHAQLLIAGDLTDGPRSWQLLPLLVNFYKEIGAQEWELDWHNASAEEHTFVVRGQHDTYMRNTGMNQRTIMGVLAEAGYISELGSIPTLITDRVALYGSSWGDCTNDTCLDWELDTRLTNILVIHAPITDQSLWESQDYFDAKRFLREHRFDLILCGDIHRMFSFQIGNRWICNTGPMIRKDASLYSFVHKPCVFVYDVDSHGLEIVTIPHRPAEEVLNREHIEKEQARVKSIVDMDKFVEKVKAARAEGYKAVKFEDNLRQLLAVGKARQSVVQLLQEVTKCNLRQQRIRT